MTDREDGRGLDSCHIRTFLCCPCGAIEYDMSCKLLSAKTGKVAMDDIL